MKRSSILHLVIMCLSLTLMVNPSHTKEFISGYAFTADILMGFKAAINDPNDMLKNWIYFTSPCNGSNGWTGTTCDDQFHVTKIDLPRAGLSVREGKSFTDSLLNFATKLTPALVQVDLSRNELTGTVPDDMINILNVDLTGNTGLTGPCTVESCHMQRDYLLAFKDAVGDPNSMLLSWDSSVDPCQWFHVACDQGNNNVIKIILGGEGLTYKEGFSMQFGKALKNLAFLPALDVLILSNNNLKGSVPEEIKKIRIVDLTGNPHLTGPCTKERCIKTPN